MDEERFNLSLRRFLKEVGITSQREIERFVREGGVAADGTKLRVKMVLTAEGTGLFTTRSTARSIRADPESVRAHRPDRAQPGFTTLNERSTRSPKI